MASDDSVVTYKRFGDVPSNKVVSSLRVEVAGGHAHIGVWNRGGKAGTLVVEASDAIWFIDALIPAAVRVVEP